MTRLASGLVNAMAAKMDSVKTLRRAAPAVAVAFLVLQAGPASAAGTAGKSYNVSCDTGTTAYASLYNITTGTLFKVRCKIVDQLTLAGIAGVTSTRFIIQAIRDVTTATTLTVTTNYTIGTFVAVGGGVYDWPLTISSGVATGDILEIQLRETGGTEIDAQRISVTQYVRVATAGVAGNARYIEVQPTTNADVSTAAGTYQARVRFIDALGSSFNPGTVTWTTSRWRDSAGATMNTGTTTAAAYDTTNNWYLVSLPHLALTSGNRQYVTIAATVGNYLYLVGFGLTAVTTQTNTPLAVPTFTTPGLFASAATTTIGDGTAPASATLAPSAAITDLNAFTLQASTGSDTVTAATVTLAPAGSFNNIGQVTLTNDAGTATYGTVANPASDAVGFTAMTLPVTAALTTFHIRITPRAHAAMPAVPGASYAMQGVVSAYTCTNTKVGTNTAAGSATLTVDNLSPGNATWGAAAPGDTQVVLSWTNPADADLSQVVILRNTAVIADVPLEGATYAAGNTLGTSSVAYAGATSPQLVTGLTNGTPYYFRAYARDTNGNYSQTGVQTGPHTPAAPPGAPGTPTFTLTTASGTTVTWTASSGANSYDLQRATDSGFTTGLVTTTGVTSPSAVGGLTASTAYWFRVVANNAGGSTTGLGSSVTTAAGPPGAPGTPTYSAVAQTSVAVSWTAASGAASYNLQRATDAAFTVGLSTFTGVTSPYSDTGPLTSGATYWYRVVAVNAQGSTTGAGSSVTTLPPAPGAPGSPTFSGIGGGGVTVAWTAGANAATYNLQRATDAGFTVNLTTLAGVTSPYADSGLAASTTYWYRAVAVNASGSARARLYRIGAIRRDGGSAVSATPTCH